MVADESQRRFLVPFLVAAFFVVAAFFADEDFAWSRPIWMFLMRASLV